MEKILKGVMKYNVAEKAKYIAGVEKTTNKIVQPLTVFFGCMDCRVFPSKFVSSDIGEIFFVRNAGNMIPHYDVYKNGSISTEGGGLELGCIINKIKNVVICGHSDCKALHALYDMRHQCDHKLHHLESPLKTWVALHGQRTVEKFNKLYPDDHCSSTGQPKKFDVNFGLGNIVADIDPENKWCMQDKLSQVHVLEQASHVTTYPYLQPLIKTGEVKVHAMWFDIFSGGVFMFSPSQRRFVLVDETSVNMLMKDVSS